MKVQYCGKYGKYVSVHHCEFFNEGKACKYYAYARWNRIKDLLADRKRPKQDVDSVIKPFQCSLIVKRDQRSVRRAV